MTEPLLQMTHAAFALLQRLITTPSFSREESATATLIQEFLHEYGIPTERHMNNVWSCNRFYDTSKPTILLNSHHDTVKPVSGWQNDPFVPVLVPEGTRTKLIGLGSNDAGAPLCGLIACFVWLYNREDLPFNLVLATTAEEEIIGKNGVESILDKLGTVSVAIVGEPTGMDLAIAEKGLVVLDGVVFGSAGHAARIWDLTANAIHNTLPMIEWFTTYRFERVSELLGPVKMTLTQIQAGTQHNVIPDRCTIVVDVRTTDAYTNEEIVDLIQHHLRQTMPPTIAYDIAARSTRLRPSSIALDHPLVECARALGHILFASPTMSDQAVIPYPSVKIGPGMSERSHTAGEYIYVDEFESGVAQYVRLIQTLAADGIMQKH
jgi:acetylornithine deacetylase